MLHRRQGWVDRHLLTKSINVTNMVLQLAKIGWKSNPEDIFLKY
jgi:hypothetical protein